MFDSVPAEMVAKLLERGHEVARGTAERAAAMARSRATIRESLFKHHAIVEVPDDSLDAVDVGDFDIAAVDGAFISEAMSIGDICTAVAVSVGPEDGQGETEIFMESVSRNPKNKELLAGVMASMEILLAARSKAKIVMIDGSMVSGLIGLSMAVHSAGCATDALSERVRAALTQDIRDASMDILKSSRFVALPKYTTKNELARWLPPEFHAQDAKTLATMALRPGEMTAWIPKEEADSMSKRSTGKALGFSEAGEKELKLRMAQVVSCYYRPHPWSSAFRLDVAEDTIYDAEATTSILRAIRDSTLSSGLQEPFPLYLVDQYAKQISAGAAPMVTSAAMENIEDDDAQIMLAQRYRT